MTLSILLRIYATLFARPRLYAFNRLLYRCSLRGMGVLNYEGGSVSGETHFLKSYFRERSGGVVIDVGANVGDYCKALVDACPAVRIHAFEPHPATYERLRANVRGLAVQCHNVAVGASEGPVELFDYAQGDGSSHASLYRDVIERTHGASSVAHRVDMIRLDDFLESHAIDRVDLLKIDTEGHELSVLAGARRYLEEGRIEAIQFEFNEMNVSSRTFFKDFWELLPHCNFYRLLPRGMLKIERYTPVYYEIFAYQNIVALLRDRHYRCF